MGHYLSFDFNFVKRFGILSIVSTVSTAEKSEEETWFTEAVQLPESPKIPCPKFSANTQHPVFSLFDVYLSLVLPRGRLLW